MTSAECVWPNLPFPTRAPPKTAPCPRDELGPVPKEERRVWTPRPNGSGVFPSINSLLLDFGPVGSLDVFILLLLLKTYLKEGNIKTKPALYVSALVFP